MLFVLASRGTREVRERCFYQCESLCSVRFRASSKLIRASAFYRTRAEVALFHTTLLIYREYFHGIKYLVNLAGEKKPPTFQVRNNASQISIAIVLQANPLS